MKRAFKVLIQYFVCACAAPLVVLIIILGLTFMCLLEIEKWALD